jgi:hypothetical protein
MDRYRALGAGSATRRTRPGSPCSRNIERYSCAGPVPTSSRIRPYPCACDCLLTTPVSTTHHEVVTEVGKDLINRRRK